MQRSILIFAACALALAPAALFLTAATTTTGAPPCVNLLRHEPVVVYEVSGFTLAGQFIDRALTLYGDGSARLSEATLDGVGSSSRWVFVGQQAATDFVRNLANLGAREVCDQPSVVSDVPLTTLTVIGPQTDARAHTASWWFPETPQLQAIQQRIDAFLCAHFGGPGCS